MSMSSDNDPQFVEIKKEDIARLRDTEQLSWAKVAEALGLGSPGAARRVYSVLVRPHADSMLAERSSSDAGVTPVHLAKASAAKITEAIEGRTIIVQRQGDKTEKIKVARVTSVKAGTVNFNDGNKSRAVKASAIIATK